MPLLSNPSLSRQVAPLLALATQMLTAGRPADAIAPLREAALLQPSNPLIQHDLGLACLEVGLVPDAIAAFQRAVADNPRYTDAWASRARNWAICAAQSWPMTAPPSCCRR